MKLNVEEHIISECFLGLSVIPLGFYLTDDIMRRNDLYIMNESERALLTTRQAEEIVAHAVGDEVVVDRKVGFDVRDLNVLIRTAIDPSIKRKIARLVGPLKRLFLSSNSMTKKKRLVDYVHRMTLYENPMDIDSSREDHCSLQEAEELRLAQEMSEKDIVHPLDDGEKRLIFAYGGLDIVKCFEEDPLSLDDKMFQLAVVQSEELGSRVLASELQSHPPLSLLLTEGWRSA